MNESSGLQSVYRQSDKLMLIVVWFLFVFSMVLAGWHDTWGALFLVGLPAAAIPTALIYLMPGALVTRLSVGTSFMIMAGLEIHQMRGLVEMHFGIFVLLAFLLYYRDWKVVAIAATTIALHHLIFNVLQGADTGVYLFENGPSFKMVLVHAAYVVFESGFLIYMSLQAEKEAVRNIELQEISEHFVIVDGKIDLRYRKEDPQSKFAEDFNAFMSAVNQAIGNSQGTASKLVSASEELLGLSGKASEGTKLQQNNTAQVASAVNEMTASVSAVAQNAREAAMAAQKADEVVKNGNRVVQNTIDSLDTLASKVDEASDVILKLENHTGNIGMVLEVIKGIADQTNLLALNAAIEAARAGEQGRGFAVVADEVRTLASRTQQSTEEIQQMIELLQNEAKNAVAVMKDGREQAHMGVEQASHTSEAFTTIADSVALISEMNSQIATAGEQQSITVDEIHRNVVEINEIAEDTAQGANSMVSSCEALTSQSEQLQIFVKKFDI